MSCIITIDHYIEGLVTLSLGDLKLDPTESARLYRAYA